VFVRSVAVVISRPRDEVFAFVADARNRPRWDDSVASEELTQPLIARTTQGNLDRGFARLKTLLEAGAASPTT
jgi:hypothetical protein